MKKQPSSGRKAGSARTTASRRRPKRAAPASKRRPSQRKPLLGRGQAGPGSEQERQRVVVVIGLPASGKSTWLRRRRIVPLSSDQLRILLADDVNEQRYQTDIFRVLRDLLRARLDLGRPLTCIDATNLVREHRAPFLRLARRRRCFVEALYFDVPLDVCLERNRARQRQVPEDVMRRMARALEPPTLQEGFHRIMTVGPNGRIVADERVEKISRVYSRRLKG